MRLKKLCPVGVFDIESKSNQFIKNIYKDDIACVARPINCTSCRECIREENNFKNNIELAKTKDKFICIFH